jgi:hypothetical protein
MVDDGRGGKRLRGTESDVTQVVMDGEGVLVMPGSGESSKSKQGVDRAVQIYDKGVENGYLTASHGSKWADTLANREEEVATTDFWGQIATYLTSMEYREGTAILYFNKLFNLARQHFLPAGLGRVGTGKGRDFFVEQGRDGSATSRWWFQLQRNVRRTCSESILRVSSPQAFSLFHFPHSF